MPIFTSFALRMFVCYVFAVPSAIPCTRKVIILPCLSCCVLRRPYNGAIACFLRIHKLAADRISLQSTKDLKYIPMPVAKLIAVTMQTANKRPLVASVLQCRDHLFCLFQHTLLFLPANKPKQSTANTY